MSSPVRSSRPRNQRSPALLVRHTEHTGEYVQRSKYVRQIIEALIYCHETSSAPPTST